MNELLRQDTLELLTYVDAAIIIVLACCVIAIHEQTYFAKAVRRALRHRQTWQLLKYGLIAGFGSLVLFNASVALQLRYWQPPWNGFEVYFVEMALLVMGLLFLATQTSYEVNPA